MSDFSTDWLELREPADRRARHDFFADPRAFVRGREIDRVLDLACGAGANFRYLAPRLAAAQRWTCIDHDPDLLRAFAGTLRAAPHAKGPAGEPQPGHFSAASGQATLQLECRDLRDGLDDVELGDGALVTASALLDLVSKRWLESLTACCARRRTHVLLALTYDGHVHCAPEDPFDARLRALVNEHQRRDKGFGPALGPAAPEIAATLLDAAGFRIARARSDWRLDARDAPLERALIEGWLGAARELDATAELDRWRTRRSADIDAGRLVITVGHVDLLASPLR